MFKLITKQEKEFVKLKFIPFLFLISVFLFASSCQSIKKKAVQNEPASASRSLAGLIKPSVGISRAQFDKLKRREGEILSSIKGMPLKVAYSLLFNEKTGRICYVESFKTRGIVPPFAQPTSYKEARLLNKPPFPKCSGQEYSMISSYQNASLLADDEKGVQVAGGWGWLGVALCGFVGVAAESAIPPDSKYLIMDKLQPINLGGSTLGAVLSAYTRPAVNTIRIIANPKDLRHNAIKNWLSRGMYYNGMRVTAIAVGGAFIPAVACSTALVSGTRYIYHVVLPYVDKKDEVFRKE